jgi:ribosome-binding protein aMBF1 (putative translation factor)
MNETNDRAGRDGGVPDNRALVPFRPPAGWARRDLGIRVRRLRLRAGLSRRALAGRAGLSEDTVARVERGVRWPRYTTVEVLAWSLGVEFDELLPPLPPGQPGGSGTVGGGTKGGGGAR